MSEEITQQDPNNLTDDQLNKLGLSEHPFTEHAGDAYLYSDEQLDMTSNIIMEYLTNPATTIVLTGEEGLGKTTFLRKILRLGYQQYQFCTLRAREGINFIDVENKIKQRWIVPQSNERSVVDLSIENYVITYLREHNHAVLIVDDADNLDASTLDRLFTLKHRIALACPSGLGLILAGSNKLSLKISELEDSNPACTQVYQINVRPLNREQCQKYVNYRLETAGLEDEVILDESNIDEIYKSSGGNIKLIHDKAIELLKSQFDEEGSIDAALDHNIKLSYSRPRVPLVIITIIALIGFGLYINHRQNIEKENAINISIPKQKELVNEQALSPLAQEASTDDMNKTPSLPLPNVKHQDSVILPPPSEHEKIIEEKVQEPDLATLEKLENDQQQVTSDAVKTEEELELPAPDTTPVNEDKTVTKEVKSKEQKYVYGKEWLRGLDSTSYTLQVIATTEPSKLEKLIKNEQLKSEYAYFSKSVKDTTYYVLVIGNYPTREDAINSVSKLPKNLRKNKPWPIKIDGVQQHL